MLPSILLRGAKESPSDFLSQCRKRKNVETTILCGGDQVSLGLKINLETLFPSHDIDVVCSHHCPDLCTMAPTLECEKESHSCSTSHRV